MDKIAFTFGSGFLRWEISCQFCLIFSSTFKLISAAGSKFDGNIDKESHGAYTCCKK